MKNIDIDKYKWIGVMSIKTGKEQLIPYSRTSYEAAMAQFKADLVNGYVWGIFLKNSKRYRIYTSSIDPATAKIRSCDYIKQRSNFFKTMDY